MKYRGPELKPYGEIREGADVQANLKANIAGIYQQTHGALLQTAGIEKNPATFDLSMLELPQSTIPLGTNYALKFDTADYRRAMQTPGAERFASINLVIRHKTTGNEVKTGLSLQNAMGWLSKGMDARLRDRNIDRVLDRAFAEVTKTQGAITHGDDLPRAPETRDGPFKALKQVVNELPM
jgi:hypothetical protein